MQLSEIKLSKRFVITFLIIVLVLEGVWAYWFLSRSSTKIVFPGGVEISNPGQSNTIFLSTPINTVKVGDSIAVDININSDKMVDGSDVIVLYDPNLLTVEPDSSNRAVRPGKLFIDYPVNEVDANKGRIGFSGISSEANGVVAKGVMGTIVFKAKASGKVNINIDYIKDSTVDSNLSETKTSKDLLNKVSGIEVNITQ